MSRESHGRQLCGALRFVGVALVQLVGVGEAASACFHGCCCVRVTLHQSAGLRDVRIVGAKEPGQSLRRALAPS